MQLLYGTYNPAKLQVMRRNLSSIAISLIGLSELPHPPKEVEETGSNPLENARIKAIAYRDWAGMPTLAADSGLYLEGVPDCLQPGEHARRIQNRRMDDEEMIAHYARIASSLGGRVTARYRNALCIALLDGTVVDRFDDSIASKSFYLVDTPHPRRTKGFPLDSLSVDMQNGLYYYDIENARSDTDLAMSNGYCQFVYEVFGGLS